MSAGDVGGGGESELRSGWRWIGGFDGGWLVRGSLGRKGRLSVASDERGGWEKKEEIAALCVNCGNEGFRY